MTAYEHGFLTKCASSGVPEELAFYLLKTAKNPPKYEYAKPGYDIFGRPLAAPAPTVQQKADAAASGISTPATTMPRPVTRRQTPASPYGAPDPANPYGTRRVSSPSPRPGDSGLTSNPSEAGVSAPARRTASTSSDPLDRGSSADPFAGQGTPSSQVVDPKTQTMGQWWKGMSQSDRKNLLSQNGMSAADFNSMDNAGRRKFLQSHYDAATGRQRQQPSFQPNEQQARMMSQWNSGTDEQRNRSLSRIGIDQNTFNGYSDEVKYNTLAQMRDSAAARRSSQPSASAGGGQEDMVSYNGSMMPRADYDRIMANKSKELTPQQIAHNRANAVGRGWQIQHATQEQRYANTRAGQPRDANGNLQTINLAGNATSPYSSRAGVRGIKPAAGS